MEEARRKAKGPLAGLRVVEMAGMGPVPFCGMLFADMGADLLTIDAPSGRTSRMPLPPSADPLFRGRSRLVLDLKPPGVADALLGVVARADVLLEGFRPGVMEQLGLGPEPCLARNPRLVYGRISGWGREGPLATVAGHDPNYLAVTGALFSIGYPDRPPSQPLTAVGDFGGGGLYLGLGVLAAVLHAREGGEGQVVDAAIVDGVASLLTNIYGMRNAGLWEDRRFSNPIDGGCPFGGSYETADGRHVTVAAMEPKFYQNFLKGLGLDPAELPVRERKENWPALRERFAAAFRTKTRDEWAAVFEGVDACVSPVLDLGEAPRYPQNVARGVFVEVDGKPVPGAAPRFRGTPTGVAPAKAGPVREVLASWGVAEATVDLLCAVEGGAAG
ncbi:MAG: CoA transferase [Deltaproteobacteria bacterium]|nr:CoA transferase [Deltaproteobacteria bacterium]